MLREKVEYMVALIAEFAEHYGITDAEAAAYMSRYNAIELCEKHYGIMHTLSFSENINNIATYCRRNGGNL